jgi:ATP-dependent helicase HrpB
VDADELTAFKARAGFAGMAVPDAASCLAELASGCVSLRELEAATGGQALMRLLESRMDVRRLDQLAPAHWTLPSGRRARVHYVEGQTPWIESRLQDFFGLTETPRIAQGSVALVCHLLAPSQRPVQITQDLAGFWQRHYPEIRRELSRRYPRHRWPENPLVAEPAPTRKA